MVEWLVVVHSDGLLACLVILIDVDSGKERQTEESPCAVVGFQVGGRAEQDELPECKVVNCTILS